MATEEDNFDIDIYGDNDYREEGQVDTDAQEHGIDSVPKPESTDTSVTLNGSAELGTNGADVHQENGKENSPIDGTSHKIGSTDDSTLDALHLPKQAPQTQGLKRKEGSDDRTADPGATTALFISELHWWITDDDIRGWANQSECEDELEDITFSEHKVNGKSKGQAYVLFKSPQAATAAKRKIESFGEGQKYRQKFTVSYTNPFTNPFKTLPKDGPMRAGGVGNRSVTGGYSGTSAMSNPAQSTFNANPGFRGGRGGGYNSRGNMANAGVYNRGGFQQPMPGSYQGASMNGYQAPAMGGMNPYNNFQNRGGMMGGMRGGSMMRGGRGGISPSPMMGMPMGGMNMAGMAGPMGPMSMGMPPMNGVGLQAGPAGFQGGQSHYNPTFFPQQGPSGVADANWNPHGAKRTRQE